MCVKLAVGFWPASSVDYAVMTTELLLPLSCETALLERFLKAEAMALWAVRSAKAKDVPAGVLSFLLRHEEEEAKHLKALVIHLFGYEALGLEFAKLLVQVQPGLMPILEDELVHVDFFEREARKVLEQGGAAADRARESAKAWWRRLAPTVDRYLEGEALEPFRPELRQRILAAIHLRFRGVGLLDEASF
jgi:hypothetical protein